MSSGIYHSELVRDTNAKGEILVEVASDIKQSKFAGKAPYIFIKYNGDERILTQEHEDYFDALILHKGDRLRIKATGTRDSAKLEVLNGAAESSEHPEGRKEEAVQQKLPVAAPNTEQLLSKHFELRRQAMVASEEMWSGILSKESVEKMSDFEFWSLIKDTATTAVIAIQ